MKIKAGHISWMKRGRVDFSALLLIAFVFQLVWPIVVFGAPDLPDEYETALRNSICQVGVEKSDQAPRENSLDGFVCDWCVTCPVSFQTFIFPAIPIGYPHVNLTRVRYPLVESDRGFKLVLNPISGPRAPPIF